VDEKSKFILSYICNGCYEFPFHVKQVLKLGGNEQPLLYLVNEIVHLLIKLVFCINFTCMHRSRKNNMFQARVIHRLTYNDNFFLFNYFFLEFHVMFIFSSYFLKYSFHIRWQLYLLRSLGNHIIRSKVLTSNFLIFNHFHYFSWHFNFTLRAFPWILIHFEII